MTGQTKSKLEGRVWPARFERSKMRKSAVLQSSSGWTKRYCEQSNAEYKQGLQQSVANTKKNKLPISGNKIDNCDIKQHSWCHKHMFFSRLSHVPTNWYWPDLAVLRRRESDPSTYIKTSQTSWKKKKMDVSNQCWTSGGSLAIALLCFKTLALF